MTPNIHTWRQSVITHIKPGSYQYVLLYLAEAPIGGLTRLGGGDWDTLERDTGCSLKEVRELLDQASEERRILIWMPLYPPASRTDDLLIELLD